MCFRHACADEVKWYAVREAPDVRDKRELGERCFFRKQSEYSIEHATRNAVGQLCGVLDFGPAEQVLRPILIASIHL